MSRESALASLMLRLLAACLVLFAVFAASRALIRALPGDPLDTLLAETGTSLSRDLLREELHLDQGYFGALGADLKQWLKGDLGVSILSRKPIGPLLAERFAQTLKLTGAVIALGLSLSLVIGLLSSNPALGGIQRGMDRFCTAFSALAAALPAPWTGPMLMYALAIALPLVPVSGSLLLPALTLSLGFIGLWSRLVRERVREVLRLGSAQAARARGIAEWKITLKYGLAPASGALIAFLGTQIGGLLSGAYVIEVIFDWPGMGSLLIESVLKRDYPLVEATIFVTGAVSMLGTLAGDGLQLWLFPQGARE